MFLFIVVCVLEMKNNITLDADETFDIAVMSYRNQRFHSARLWMQETFRKLNAGEKATISREDVLYHLALFSCHLSDDKGTQFTRHEFIIIVLSTNVSDRVVKVSRVLFYILNV